jgi:hypothetical protein
MNTLALDTSACSCGKPGIRYLCEHCPDGGDHQSPHDSLTLQVPNASYSASSAQPVAGLPPPFPPPLLFTPSPRFMPPGRSGRQNVWGRGGRAPPPHPGFGIGAGLCAAATEPSTPPEAAARASNRSQTAQESDLVLGAVRLRRRRQADRRAGPAGPGPGAQSQCLSRRRRDRDCKGALALQNVGRVQSQAFN